MSAVIQPMTYAPAPSSGHDTSRLPLGKAVLLAVLIEGLMLATIGFFFSREAAPKPPMKITELVEMAPPKQVEAVKPEPEPKPKPQVEAVKPEPEPKPKPQPVVKQQITPSPPTPKPIAKSTAPSPIATPPTPVSPPVNAAPAPIPPPVAVAPTKPVVQPPSAGNSEIVAVNRSKPNYPRRAIQAGLEGWVKLSFTVTADGQVKDIKVIDANPPRLFDDEAVRAIQQWTFKPRKQDGKAVEGNAIQTVEFKLSDQ